MTVNLIVIKTKNPANLKQQYEALGIVFDYHKHGNGPFHYSAQLNELVFEIYPLPPSVSKVENTTRLGFVVEKLDDLIPILTQNGWLINKNPQQTAWGYMAVIQDFDGRKVELTEK